MALAALPSADPFWIGLAAHGETAALFFGDEVVSYASLADRVSSLVARLEPIRRLVVLEAGNDVDTVVGYLACLTGGHPVLLTESASAVAAYDPDVVLSGSSLRESREGRRTTCTPRWPSCSRHRGPPGRPSWLRLSAENVSSNAAAIASYLQFRSPLRSSPPCPDSSKGARISAKQRSS